MTNEPNEKISELQASMEEKQNSLNEVQRKFEEFMKPKGIEKTKFGDAVILSNNVLMINCGSPETLNEIIEVLKK